MGLVLFVYLLFAISQTNKKESNMEAPGLHIIQYYNIYETYDNNYNIMIIMIIIII